MMNLSIMPYVDRVIAHLGYIKAADIPQSALALFAGEALPQSYFVSQTEEEIQKLAITNPWVYANISLIARRISMGIMKVQEQQADGSWVDDPTHEFTKLVEQRPNPFMGQAYVWEYQIFWLLLRGEMYWLLAPDDSGELQQLYPLPANRLYPEPDSKIFIRGYWYHGTATGKPEFLDVEQVCFDRLPNPFNYHRGLSPLVAYTLGLQIDRAAQVFERDDYRDGLTLRHIVSLRPEISDTDALRFKREIDEGQAEKRRYMVTRGGDIDVKPMQSRGSAEARSSDVRIMTQKEADYVYGIPEGLRTSSATQANATVAERTFISDTIWPLMVLIAEDMTVQIVTRYYEENQKSVFEDIRIKDIEGEMAVQAHAREVQTFDEARADIGLDPYYDEEIGKEKLSVVDDLIKAKAQAMQDEMLEEEIEGKSFWSEVDYWRTSAIADGSSDNGL